MGFEAEGATKETSKASEEGSLALWRAALKTVRGPVKERASTPSWRRMRMRTISGVPSSASAIALIVAVGGCLGGEVWEVVGGLVET